MANPFFNNNNQSGVFGNMQNLVAQFNQFRQNMQGDPRQQVEAMLKNGQVSQEQFNQCYAKAVELYNSGLFQNGPTGGNPFSKLFGK